MGVAAGCVNGSVEFSQLLWLAAGPRLWTLQDKSLKHYYTKSEQVNTWVIFR